MATHITIEEGDLETFPRQFVCPKCAAKFKARKDSVQINVIDYERKNCYPELCCFITAGQKTTEYITCPTPKCGETFVIKTYTSNGLEEKCLCCNIL